MWLLIGLGELFVSFLHVLVVVAGILAVGAKHSFGLAVISHVALFTTSEVHWCISVVG